MINVEKVSRKGKIPVLVKISFGNIIVSFRRHTTEKNRKVVECGRIISSRIYDKHNVEIDDRYYKRIKKKAYAILYPKIKEVKPITQLDWITMGCDFSKLPK